MKPLQTIPPEIKGEDIEIEHIRGSGPGGQHRNKRFTGIRMTHLPTGLVVMATERRSQKQNLMLAYERLDERITKHFHKAVPRVATRVSKTQKKKRLSDKRTVASKKQGRRFQENSDD